jgi:hypothetical protein
MRFFEESGYISFIICEKFTPMSSSVFKHSFSLPIYSSWALFVSLRFVAASSDLTPAHSRGGFLPCRTSASLRAKKSPHLSQNQMSSGCFSAVSQCLLKSSHVLIVVLGQSRHFKAWTTPRAKSTSVATRSALCIVLNFLGILNSTISSSSSCSAAAAPCC